MARVEQVLVFDIGAAAVKAAEFEYGANGAVTLTAFATKEYDDTLAETDRLLATENALRAVLAEGGFTSRKAMVSISGQSAFIRFVRLPLVSDEEKRVRQIVEFEAKQNVPFPMSEVIWDYQLIASPDTGEMDVMFVVIKNEIVEHVTNMVVALGLDPVVVDIAPVACYNAARANHVGDDECSVILNIGSRSCNLLFADKDRFFARTIPIAGHAITQQIAKEFSISMTEAEEMKRRHGFVALGGAYEDPDSEVAATVSKIVRSVMARLHGEINRSITVYRSQQKGNRPTKMYLAGGSSIMGYTDRFFREACDVQVTYLNPFQVINIAPTVDVRKLEEVAHIFSEVVGLGLRYKVQCPVEISLLPEKIRALQAFALKKPYLATAAAVVLLGVGVWGLDTKVALAKYDAVLETNSGKIKNLQNQERQVIQQRDQAQEAARKIAQLESVLASRHEWAAVFSALQAARPLDLWLTQVEPLYDGLDQGGRGDTGRAAAPPAAAMPGFGGFGGFAPAMPPPGRDAAAAAGSSATPAASVLAGTFKITGFRLTGHTVNVKPQPAGSEETAGLPAHTPLAEGLYWEALRKNPLFDAEKTRIEGSQPSDTVPNLSSFTMRVVLKQPISVSR